jgi:hypothetical protein
MTATLICRVCQKPKTLDEMMPRADSTQGYLSQCRMCRATQTSEAAKVRFHGGGKTKLGHIAPLDSYDEVQHRADFRRILHERVDARKVPA